MSRADVDRIDEDRVRKVAADNPDLLHSRLAQRFGMSVTRLRKILGLHGAGAVSELLNPTQIQHYTPRPGASRNGNARWMRWQGRRDHLRKQLRAQEDGKRTAWEPHFVPMRPPNGRGSP